MQVDHITTTAFHPQASGMVEQLHHQLKEALCAKGATSAWADHLPRIILGLHAASKDESEVSATEAALGQLLVIPGQPKAPEGTVPAALHAPLAVIPPTKWTYAEVAAPPSPLDSADKYKGHFHMLSHWPKVSSSRWGRGRGGVILVADLPPPPPPSVGSRF